MPFHTVARVGEIAPGEVKPVDVEGVEMVVVRSGDEYYALQRRCLHAGGDLADGLVSRGHIVCAYHQWRFDVDTGRHDMSAQNCLHTFEVRVSGGEIQVDPTPVWQGELP